MENSILATVSLLNILVGIATGMAYIGIFRMTEYYRLENELEKAKTKKFEQDLYVDELLEQIEYLETRASELEDHVNRAVALLTSSLPAPLRNEDGKLDRQIQCVDDEDVVEFTLHSKMD